MKKQTLGMMISVLRKEKNLTQLELANMMNVTDKAVSKWERDISCPDINSLPRLSEILGVTVDQLMQCQGHEGQEKKASVAHVMNLILRVIPLAMGIAVTVLSILGELDAGSGFPLVGIALFCMALYLLNNKTMQMV